MRLYNHVTHPCMQTDLYYTRKKLTMSLVLDDWFAEELSKIVQSTVLAISTAMALITICYYSL
jgi:hypothetical protein